MEEEAPEVRDGEGAVDGDRREGGYVLAGVSVGAHVRECRVREENEVNRRRVPVGKSYSVRAFSRISQFSP